MSFCNKRGKAGVGSAPFRRKKGAIAQRLYRKGQLLFLLALTLVGCEKKSPPPPPPPEVQVLSVKPTDVPIFEEWIGTLDGSINAQIRAQVTGYIQEQKYAEGTEVKKGDLLFQIDPRPFQATLDQALAKLAQDKAQAGKTHLDVTRYIPLAKEQAISQEELDDAVQANLGAEAQLKADNAMIETAQLNLNFTRITSPIDGLVGIALAQNGDLVGQSGTVLTTVSTIDPIKVYFQVSEQSYLTFWRKFIDVQGSDQGLDLQLILSDNSVFPEKGKVIFADRQVNANTGTLQVVGLFSNPKLLLRPGQYGRVRAQTDTKKNVILLPQRAVAELQGTYQVVTVDAQNKAHLKQVKVGQQIGSDWIIESGLQTDDKVVIEGTQRAKEGTVVSPKPYQPVANQAGAAPPPQ